ncbi:MAG: aldehyde dehydrogenase family protein [bacterium]
MGKPIAESRGEAGSVAAKIHTTIAQLKHELPGRRPRRPRRAALPPAGRRGRHRPVQLPVHLVNTHIIPALLTGNVVVVKPSEITPLSGQIYAEVFAAAGLPPGVFNLIHGLGATGAALAGPPWRRWRHLHGQLRHGPPHPRGHLRSAMEEGQPELGGRNPAVVLDDAHLEQTVRRDPAGALLSTGQRSPPPSRHRHLAASPRSCSTGWLGPSRPRSRVIPSTATRSSARSRPRPPAIASWPCSRTPALRAPARVESRAPPGGAFVTPSLYQVQGDEAFLREELFGPHLDFEIAEDDEDAFARAARNPLASARASSPPAMRCATPSTTASAPASSTTTAPPTAPRACCPSAAPGMSGNWSPAGSLAPRLCTYPVAIMVEPHGRLTPHAALDDLLETIR